MTWICSECGQENADDILRCSCGHEAQEISVHGGKEIKPTEDVITQIHAITNCPECNSNNIEKYSSNKRGYLLLLSAAISFGLSFIIRDGGYILYLSVPFLFVGLRLLYKNKNIIICKDCLYSNYK